MINIKASKQYKRIFKKMLVLTISFDRPSHQQNEFKRLKTHNTTICCNHLSIN